MPKFQFKFEYVTSTVPLFVWMNQGDGIEVDVVNDSDVTEKARIVIYKNTGAGAVLATENTSDVVKTWRWALGYTIPESSEYWVRIQTTSEFLIPSVRFVRLQNGVWVPVVSYRPGDFAVFKLQPSRQRIW